MKVEEGVNFWLWVYRRLRTEVDLQSRDLPLGLCVLTIGEPAKKPKKWALGKRHLWEKS